MDGKFHLCLLNDDELDARKTLRSNSSDVIAEVSPPAGKQLDAGPRDVPNRRIGDEGSDDWFSPPLPVDVRAGSLVRWPVLVSWFSLEELYIADLR